MYFVTSRLPDLPEPEPQNKGCQIQKCVVTQIVPGSPSSFGGLGAWECMTLKLEDMMVFTPSLEISMGPVFLNYIFQMMKLKLPLQFPQGQKVIVQDSYM